MSATTIVVVNEWVRASGSGRREGVSRGSRKVNTTRMEYKMLWREQVSESQRRRLRLSMEHKTASSGVGGASTGDTRSRSRAAAGGGLRLACHWPAPHSSMFGPMLHLAQDSSPLACSSHHAPQSPWGKLQSHLTKTLSPLWPPLLRHVDNGPTANLTSREASRTTCGFAAQAAATKAYHHALRRVMPHSLSEACMQSFPKGLRPCRQVPT